MEKCSFGKGYLVPGSILVVGQILVDSIMGDFVQGEELQSGLAGSRTPLMTVLKGQLAD